MVILSVLDDISKATYKRTGQCLGFGVPPPSSQNRMYEDEGDDGASVEIQGAIGGDDGTHSC